MLPFSLDPELRKIARALYTQREAIGVTEMIVWTARKPFLDKNRAAMVDFMEDTLRIVQWYLDPKNQKEAAEIAARVTKQPAERFGWLFTEKDYYRTPTRSRTSTRCRRTSTCQGSGLRAREPRHPGSTPT